MSDFQDQKAIVSSYYDALDCAQHGELSTAISRFTTADYHWRGMHPFYEQRGAAPVAEVFWEPYRAAFSAVQRRQDVFMAGANDVDNGETEWVVSMGHLMGLFDKPWLGIPPTFKMAFLRYVEFHRVADGKIHETALFIDVVSIMQQAGLNPLPLQTGAAIITPGPRTHDGLQFGQQDAEEGRKTLALINRMIDDLVGSGMESRQGELLETWHTDMCWFGPAGIGATYTTERYQEQHQGPFGRGLKDIRFNGHVCRFAEGNFGGFFGWANLSMKSAGGFLGMPASDAATEMRVVDIYRREGDRLAENWIFIDLLHFLALQGLDVLERMRTIVHR